MRALESAQATRGIYAWTMEPQASPASDRAATLLSDLIAINSVNPLQAGPKSGSGGEAAIAHWLAEITGALGAEVTVDEVEPGRPNVYAYFNNASGPTIVVDVHLDTVGVEHMTDEPFDGRHEGGRVYGRGAVDTKATLAILIALLEQVTGTNQLSANLLLVGTIAEEEGGLLGAYRFRDWANEHHRRFDQVVVAEPTSCVPVHGHKGGVGLEITVKGEAAHSSKPQLGRNAIEAAARIIRAFQAEHDLLVSRRPLTAVGTGTLSVTQIGGGLARNIIPDECTLYAGRRIAPGENPSTVFDALRTLAIGAAAPLEIEVSMANGRGSDAFYQDADSPLVSTLCSLAGAEPATATYGSNALVYAPIADEIVVFGPGSIDQAHKAVEWIEIAEIQRATAIYAQWLTGPTVRPE